MAVKFRLLRERESNRRLAYRIRQVRTKRRCNLWDAYLIASVERRAYANLCRRVLTPRREILPIFKFESRWRNGPF